MANNFGTQDSSQSIDNRSFNSDYQIGERLIYGYSSGDTDIRAVAVNSDGELKVNLETSDIEIGAVEIKNATSDDRIKVNTDGTFAGGILPETFDYTDLTQAATTDTWVFKTGGSGGSTVATITITYTDATKATIDNVART